MWTDRKTIDLGNWTNSSANSRVSGNLTPRTKQKPNIPIQSQRRSITPSRMSERVTSSPLKIPL